MPPLSRVGSVVTVVLGYVAEVRPTLVRSRATGFAAGMTKAGGALVLALTVAAATVPSLFTPALMGSVRLLPAAFAFVRIRPETKGRRLEDITRQLLLDRLPTPADRPHRRLTRHVAQETAGDGTGGSTCWSV